MRRFSEFPCLTNDAILLVQSYQDGKMYGQLIHPRTGMPEEIRSIPQLILRLDEILLQEHSLVGHYAHRPVGFDGVDRIATLRIQILFREQYTWQGRILWEEQRKEATFRSVLELIQILDEILAG